MPAPHNVPVAQRIERPHPKRIAAGSTPARDANQAEPPGDAQQRPDAHRCTFYGFRQWFPRDLPYLREQLALLHSPGPTVIAPEQLLSRLN